MKETNEKAIIRLTHLPSGEAVDWIIAPRVTPAVLFLEERAERFRQQLEAYISDNNLQADNRTEATQEQLQKLAELNDKLMQARIKTLAVVLAPKEPLPPGTSKVDYLEECITSYEMMNEILIFFSKHSARSTGSPGASPKLQILDSAGNPWPTDDDTSH